MRGVDFWIVVRIYKDLWIALYFQTLRIVPRALPSALWVRQLVSCLSYSLSGWPMGSCANAAVASQTSAPRSWCGRPAQSALPERALYSYQSRAPARLARFRVSAPLHLSARHSIAAMLVSEHV